MNQLEVWRNAIGTHFIQERTGHVICDLSQIDGEKYADLFANAPELLEGCEAALFALEGQGPVAAQLRSIINKIKRESYPWISTVKKEEENG